MKNTKFSQDYTKIIPDSDFWDDSLLARLEILGTFDILGILAFFDNSLFSNLTSSSSFSSSESLYCSSSILHVFAESSFSYFRWIWFFSSSANNASWISVESSLKSLYFFYSEIFLKLTYFHFSLSRFLLSFYFAF